MQTFLKWMLNFKNLKSCSCLEVIWKGSIQYYAKCMLNFCNALVVIVEYSSKTVPIERNLPKPIKCIIENTTQVNVFHAIWKRGK